MIGPERFVEWINGNIGFNPRAAKYSRALSEFVVDDLSEHSSALRNALDGGVLVAQTDADVATAAMKRNIDLVIWNQETGVGIGEVSIAVENKLIMAAHGKARKNRLGDIVAFSNHIHNANRSATAGGLIVINLSVEYANPDPFAKDMERPAFNMENVVRDTVEIYSNLPQRNDPDGPHDQPEAFGVFVIMYDGKSAARLVADPPAPQPGHKLHYGTFIERLASHYDSRS